MPEFKIGELYFMIWYPDQEFQNEQSGLFLVPDSVVFVGKNLDAGLDGERWYFQDTWSYCKYGSYPINNEGLAPDQRVGNLVCLREAELDQIVDSQGLAKVVLECAERRRAAGALG